MEEKNYINTQELIDKVNKMYSDTQYYENNTINDIVREYMKEKYENGVVVSRSSIRGTKKFCKDKFLEDKEIEMLLVDLLKVGNDKEKDRMQTKQIEDYCYKSYGVLALIKKWNIFKNCMLYMYFRDKTAIIEVNKTINGIYEITKKAIDIVKE